MAQKRSVCYDLNMAKINLKYFEEKLREERATLERELETVGRKNPANQADWEPKPSKMDILPSDDSDVADSIEAYEDNAGILKQLEIRFNEVGRALERIENGTYGFCEIDKKPIEAKRLEANPAATTCLEHMK